MSSHTLSSNSNPWEVPNRDMSMNTEKVLCKETRKWTTTREFRTGREHDLNAWRPGSGTEKKGIRWQSKYSVEGK